MNHRHGKPLVLSVKNNILNNMFVNNRRYNAASLIAPPIS